MEWLVHLARLLLLGAAAHEQYTTRHDPRPMLSRETWRVLFDHKWLVAVSILWATSVLASAVCLVLIAAKVSGFVALLGALALSLGAFVGQSVLDATCIEAVKQTLRGRATASTAACVARVLHRIGPIGLWPLYRLFRRSMVTRIGLAVLLDGAKSLSVAAHRAEMIEKVGVDRSGSWLLFGPLAFLLVVPGFVLAFAAGMLIPDGWPVGNLPFDSIFLWGGAAFVWPLLCFTGLIFATRAIETAAAYIYVVDGRKPMYFTTHAISALVSALPTEPLALTACNYCGYEVSSRHSLCPECRAPLGGDSFSG